jgi:hypothetical protein
MAEFWGNLSMFNNSKRITPNGSPKQEKNTGVYIPHPLPDSHVSRSKSNSFSGNRVSPAPLQKEDIEHIETLPCTPMSGHESGMNTPQLDSLSNGYGKAYSEGLHAIAEQQSRPSEYALEYDMHEWLEIDHPSEHNYIEHVRTSCTRTPTSSLRMMPEKPSASASGFPAIYKQVLDDLYRRFAPPTNIHEKYLEEIRSPSWETFEKKHKK